MATQANLPQPSFRFGWGLPVAPSGKPSQKAPSPKIKIHSCQLKDMAFGEKPPTCKCKSNIGFIDARVLLDHGKADWLLKIRNGKPEQVRTSLVLRYDYAQSIAVREKVSRSPSGAINKNPLSFTNLEAWFPATEKRVYGIDQNIEACRLMTIKERSKYSGPRRTKGSFF